MTSCASYSSANSHGSESRDSEPWELAELYEAQEVIDPRETRQYLIDMLEIYRGRMSGGLSEHLLSSWPTSYV